mmetsp:Transcript_3706/g.9649  ORF Transcript_3706/g.9649 Transcript_3706/m.9649 type:complete len:238 (-) Transcript_3706:698-1411(-)
MWGCGICRGGGGHEDLAVECGTGRARLRASHARECHRAVGGRRHLHCDARQAHVRKRRIYDWHALLAGRAGPARDRRRDRGGRPGGGGGRQGARSCRVCGHVGCSEHRHPPGRAETRARILHQHLWLRGGLEASPWSARAERGREPRVLADPGQLAPGGRDETSAGGRRGPKAPPHAGAEQIETLLLWRFKCVAVLLLLGAGPAPFGAPHRHRRWAERPALPRSVRPSRRAERGDGP